MSHIDDDYIDVGAPRRISLEEQRTTAIVQRGNYVPALPERKTPVAYPVQSPANDALGQLVTGLMSEARTIHHADPITRGVSILIKTTAITFFLAALTLAGLAMLDSLTFFFWMFLASLEWVICFLYLAYKDWQEHPSAIRWTWTQGLLAMMEREQEARLRAQYGKDWDA